MVVGATVLGKSPRAPSQEKDNIFELINGLGGKQRRSARDSCIVHSNGRRTHDTTTLFFICPGFGVSKGGFGVLKFGFQLGDASTVPVQVTVMCSGKRHLYICMKNTGIKPSEISYIHAYSDVVAPILRYYGGRVVRNVTAD